MTFAEMFRAALAVHGYDLATPGAQERFRRLLAERHGVDVTDSAVSSWLTGVRVPRTSHLVAILDALVVPEAERSPWLSACASHEAPLRASRPEEAA